MTFTTLEFAYFFAAVFIVYHLLPQKYKWMLLVPASAYFYASCGLPAFFMLCAMSLLAWGAAVLIEKSGKKSVLILSYVLLTLFLMGLMRLPALSFIMPLGFSFYALQCMSYVTEVYRESIKPLKNPLKVYIYTAYFPHVLQGPFEDTEEFLGELFAGKSFSYENAREGAGRFVLGLLKKLVLADRIGYIVDPVFSDVSGYHGFTVVFVMLLYSVQLYADFSGYMDMAVGASKMLNIGIRENFNVPFASKSMAEFWRRWHMSLGLWFKSYVFYPALRSKPLSAIRTHFKKKKNRYLMNTLPTCLALTLNWTLIGLWHGFDMNYLCYDWFCGAVIIISEFLKPLYDKCNDKTGRFSKSKAADALRICRTFLLTAFSFMLFRPATISDSFTMIGNIFSAADIHALSMFMYNNIYDIFLIALPALIILINDICLYRGEDLIKKSMSFPLPLRWAAYLFVALIIYIAKGDRSAAGFAYYIF
ncbi:MAG: MBOAT family protein [Lachnospiraceae bacterium]|nr:MBOAT family protein [Lachnospiraceae bacterium]